MVQEGILKFSSNGKQKHVVRDAITAKIYDDLARKFNKPVREEDLSQLTTPESKKQSQKAPHSDALHQKFHDVLQVSRSDLQIQTNNVGTVLKRREKGDMRLSQDSAKVDPRKLSEEFHLKTSKCEDKSGVPSRQATFDQDSSTFQQARDKLGESSFEPFAVALVDNSKKSFQKSGQKQCRDDSLELSCSQNAELNDKSVSLPAQPMFQYKRPRLQSSQ
jgi:hypothetical protein